VAKVLEYRYGRPYIEFRRCSTMGIDEIAAR